MKTKLITLNVSMKAPPSKLRLAVSDSGVLASNALRSHIETQLKTHGTPLRWSITYIDSVSKTAHIEAIVTTI